VDPELFFPVGSGGSALLQVAAAKAVCGRCPVSTPCLMWALVRDVDGVWGGLSQDERRAIRRRAAARHVEHDNPLWQQGSPSEAV
jgi:WhiB family redox-sensing transcriptional regulator